MADIQSDKTDAPAPQTAGTRLAAKRAAKAARKAASRGTTDAVQEAAASTALEASAWIDKHGRAILLVLGGALVAAVAVLLVSNARQSKAREAGALLHTAVTTAQGIVVPADETPPEEPLVPVFPSVKEREEKAFNQFQEVVKKFPDSLGATYAQLGEANAQLRLGKYTQASALFEKLRAQGADSNSKGGSSADDAGDFVRFRTLEGAGYALEGQQKYAEAAERFEALSQLHQGEYRMLGDYHRARMLVAQGKRDDAKKLLEALLKAEAAKPAEGEAAPAPEAATDDSFESARNAAQTLLTELGGTPPERGAGASGISQEVLNSLRKQLSTQTGQ